MIIEGRGGEGRGEEEGSPVIARICFCYKHSPVRYELESKIYDLKFNSR